MNGTIVVLVNGEVLSNGQGSKIADQRHNVRLLAEGLYPILSSDLKVAILHGNKPQVGFVLFRSELASHVLHTVPLDVCGADTQGATGYMLSQALMNILNRKQLQRRVMSVITQTLVDPGNPAGAYPLKAIGPWFDRDKAELYRHTRDWTMVEEPGRGYRRGVPTLPAKAVIEMEGIQSLVDAGDIVIAGGGGGIPVVRNANGDLEGIEAVVETEQVASMIARHLAANILLMVIDKDHKFIRSGLSTESSIHLSVSELDTLIHQETLSSSTVMRTLEAAKDFLAAGGEQVVITTLRKLPETLTKRSGLRIGNLQPSIDLFRVLAANNHN